MRKKGKKPFYLEWGTRGRDDDKGLMLIPF